MTEQNCESPSPYDPFSHRWLLHYVIASSSKIAEIAGQRLEGKVQRQSALNLRRAAQASLADNTDALDKFLQTIGGDLEIFESDQSFIITRHHDTVLNTCP